MSARPPKRSALSSEACKSSTCTKKVTPAPSGIFAYTAGNARLGLRIYEAVVHWIIRGDLPVEEIAIELLEPVSVLAQDFEVYDRFAHLILRCCDMAVPYDLMF